MLVYRYKQAQFCKERKGKGKGKEKERQQARSDCRICAAKSFSGIEEMTPVT
jgi:hypothetical protein